MLSFRSAPRCSLAGWRLMLWSLGDLAGVITISASIFFGVTSSVKSYRGKYGFSAVTYFNPCFELRCDP